MYLETYVLIIIEIKQQKNLMFFILVIEFPFLLLHVIILNGFFQMRELYL